MSMRLEVALAIYGDEAPVWTDDYGEQRPADWDDLHDTEWLDQGYEHWVPPKEHYLTQADAAIAAVFDRLIAEWSKENGNLDLWDDEGRHWSIPDWLRAQQGATDEA